MSDRLLQLTGLHKAQSHHLVRHVSTAHGNPVRDGGVAVGPPSVHTSQYSNSAKLSEAKADTKTLQNLLNIDCLSFLSGTCIAVLQAAPVVNRKRRKAGASDEEKAEHTALVESIEARLNQQNFSFHGTFKLDGIENRILLRPDEHSSWDLYGLFALTPHKNVLSYLCGILDESNTAWQKARISNPAALRVFSRLHQIILEEEPSWVVLLLDPWAFLHPDERLWMSYPQIRGQRRTGRLVHTHPEDRTFPYLCDDAYPTGLNQGARVYTERGSTQRLSLFAMVTNAFAKVQAAVRRGKAHEEVHAYYELLKAALERIMFVPRASADSAMDTNEPRSPESPLTGPLASPDTPTVSAVAHATVLPLTTGGSMPSVGDCSPQLPMPETEFAAAPQGMLAHHLPSESDEFTEELPLGFGPAPQAPEPILDDGLTVSESQILLARTGDAELSSEERAEALVLLLCGTGHNTRFGSDYQSDEDME